MFSNTFYWQKYEETSPLITLLVRTEFGTDFIERNLRTFNNIIYALIFWPSNLTSRNSALNTHLHYEYMPRLYHSIKSTHTIILTLHVKEWEKKSQISTYFFK